MANEPRAARRRPRRSLPGWLLALLVLLVLLALLGAAAGVWLADQMAGRGGASALEGRSPNELLRHALIRLQGHPKLEAVLHPAMYAWQRQLERPVTLGPAVLAVKGQREFALPGQRYDAQGRPLPLPPRVAPVRATESAAAAAFAAPALVPVSSTEALLQAVARAQPGQVIEIMPGQYRLDVNIWTPTAGRADAPIVVRALAPGTVTLELRSVEGWVVNQPHWMFENLVLRGRCGAEEDCEHAFHVVAGGRSTVIRNNRMVNFNSAIKVNIAQDTAPDDGLVQFNTLVNDAPRDVMRPVTPVDIVGASRWQVLDNAVANFVRPNQKFGITYGIFMKGGGQDGVIARNLVVCSMADISAAGERVGISLGGGLTGAQFCRDKRCVVEHAGGVVANNVIAHCNGPGVDNNRAVRTLVLHNTLVNTTGLLARGEPSVAEARRNLLEGALRSRNDAQWLAADNPPLRAADFPQRDALLLAPSEGQGPPLLPRDPHPALTLDFCGQPRQAQDWPGALSHRSRCLAQQP